MAAESPEHKSNVPLVLWIALGTALTTTAASAFISAAAVRESAFRWSIESIGLSRSEAARPAASAAQNVRAQLVWAGSLAVLALAGWVLSTVRLRRQRRSTPCRRRRHLVVIGIVVGLLASSLVAFLLMLIADAMTSPGRSTF
jgi:hypothetical protein